MKYREIFEVDHAVTVGVALAVAAGVTEVGLQDREVAGVYISVKIKVAVFAVEDVVDQVIEIVAVDLVVAGPIGACSCLLRSYVFRIRNSITIIIASDVVKNSDVWKDFG